MKEKRNSRADDPLLIVNTESARRKMSALVENWDPAPVIEALAMAQRDQEKVVRHTWFRAYGAALLRKWISEDKGMAV